MGTFLRHSVYPTYVYKEQLCRLLHGKRGDKLISGLSVSTFSWTGCRMPTGAMTDDEKRGKYSIICAVQCQGICITVRQSPTRSTGGATIEYINLFPVLWNMIRTFNQRPIRDFIWWGGGGNETLKASIGECRQGCPSLEFLKFVPRKWYFLFHFRSLLNKVVSPIIRAFCHKF